MLVECRNDRTECIRCESGNGLTADKWLNPPLESPTTIASRHLGGTAVFAADIALRNRATRRMNTTSTLGSTNSTYRPTMFVSL